jgi:hypothetical protein
VSLGPPVRASPTKQTSVPSGHLSHFSLLTLHLRLTHGFSSLSTLQMQFLGILPSALFPHLVSARLQMPPPPRALPELQHHLPFVIVNSDVYTSISLMSQMKTISHQLPSMPLSNWILLIPFETWGLGPGPTSFLPTFLQQFCEALHL